MALTSILSSAANNIVNLNRSKPGMRKTQGDFSSFLRFMDVQTGRLESQKFDQRKLKKALNANVTTSFGRSGNLLSGLASGALDAASFVGDFFGSNRKVSPKAGQPIQKGSRIKLGGVRALGIANAVFAGLDFATGLAEGEGVGKAAAGAGGNLAGSLIGGAIGQALIPIPGLGFVLGSMAGGFAGGFLGDRAYEAGTSIKDTISQKLQIQSQKQQALAAGVGAITINEVLNKFDSVVSNFNNMPVRGVTTMTSEEQEILQESKQTTGNEPTTDPNIVGMEGEGTFVQGNTGRSRGDHFHIGPEENYGKPQGLQDARDGALKVSKALLSKGVPILYSNAEVWVRPSQKLSDAELMNLIKQEQDAHRNRSGGGSFGGIDIATTKGTKLPYPVRDVKDRGDGFGISGVLVGTKAFVGHGAVGSKSTPTAQIKQGMTGATPEGTMPTIVLAGGTNDYGSPATAKANMTRTIKELQGKGYRVIVVPPSEQGVFGNVSKSVQEAAAQTGATIEKGQYNPKDRTKAYAHLDPNESKRIREKYKGATFMGDSNASGLAGGDVSGRIKTGASTDEILSYVQNIPTAQRKLVTSTATAPQVSPSLVQTQPPPQQVSAPQISSYPSYAVNQSSVVILPIGQGGQQAPVVVSQGSGGEVTITPTVSGGTVLNNLMKSILLTTLSGT